MDFFKRFQRQQPAPAVGGYIAYYGLTDWWLATFTSKERDDIALMHAPLASRVLPLTQGHIATAPQSAADFLSNLADTYFQGRNNSIGARIRAKVKELGGEPHPGIYKGKHYTAYVEQVKQLKRDCDMESAERLLLALVDVVETEARIKQQGVAPWYYEELAKLYRQRKDYAAEVAILERCESLAYPAGVVPPRVSPSRLDERLDKARALLAESQGR